MATLNVANFYNEPNFWTAHRPDYAALLNIVGPAAGAADRTGAAKALVNQAKRSPVVVALTIHGDDEHIYVAHSPSEYASDPLNGTNYDGLVVVLVGNDLQTSYPVAIPAVALTRSVNVRCNTTAVISGNTMHGAAPIVHRSGPHQAGTPNTDSLDARLIMLLPFTAGHDLLSTNPDGRYSLHGFYNTFVQPGLADAATQAEWAPVEDWWRRACTIINVGGDNVGSLQFTPVSDPLPHTQQALNRWVGDVKGGMLVRAGEGGPGLTSAAFNQGVATLRQTLDDNNAAQIDYHRQRSEKSYTEKHGTSAAQQLHRWCGVADDANLPAVHRTLAKATKGQEYGILQHAFEQRASTTDLPVTPSTAPVATTSLVTSVFRDRQVAGNGQRFGLGITPFAVFMQGDEEAYLLAQKSKTAALVEAGGAIDLADATELRTSSAKFPRDVASCREKLDGWSILVDVFHGHNSPIATRVRDFVRISGPLMHRVTACQEGNDSAAQTLLACRLLYEAQQDYYTWLHEQAASDVPVDPPDFRHIKGNLTSYRLDKLSSLPKSWSLHYEDPAGKPTPKTRERDNSNQTGTAFNGHADSTLMARFQNSGFPTIQAMREGKDAAIPKHNNKEVCLNWALKGKCTNQ